MSSLLYYTAPSDEVFNEVKREAIKVWEGLDSHPSYLEEKLLRIRDLQNIDDNVMYIVAMFDHHNQSHLARQLSIDSRLALRERMESGGQPNYLIPF